MERKTTGKLAEESMERIVGGIHREVVAVYICENCGEHIEVPISDLSGVCPKCKAPLPALPPYVR